MSDAIELGKKGEEIALLHLKSNSYNILETNWRFRHLELDIIAMKDNILVVVEVKTRSSDYFEQPPDTVNRRKQKLIIEATNSYIDTHDISQEVRFDIITIYFSARSYKLDHIEDAFYPVVNK